jgi:hypothetical protein
MVEAARAVHGTTARVSAGSENRVLAKKPIAAVKIAKSGRSNFHLSQNQMALE